MDRFETESMALLPGQRVQARILSREPWGVIAQIVGYEHIGASIDMIEQFGAWAIRNCWRRCIHPSAP